MLGRHLVELGERHAGLDNRYLVLGVDLHPLHTLERHDDTARARDRGARQTSAASARGHGDAVLVAHAEDRCDFARGLWQEDSNRDDRRRAERLVVRVLVVRIAGEDAIGGQDAVEQCRHDVARCSLLSWIIRLTRLTSRWGTVIPGR